MKSDKWPRIFGFLYFGYIFITMVFEPIIRLSDVAFIVDVFIGFPLLIIGGIYMFVAQRRDKTFFSKMFDEKKNIFKFHTKITSNSIILIRCIKFEDNKYELKWPNNCSITINEHSIVKLMPPQFNEPIVFVQ